MKSAVTISTGVLVFLAGLAGAGALSSRINGERRAQNLTVSDEVYDLPPEMAVMQAALGTFRGLAINVLWQRAEDLKSDGKYHEAIDMGKLITRLQPHFPKVWEFVSWNQAYNISVGTSTPEERWMWVKSGIDLLQSRGGGIDANPNALALYQQLGWIYFHKVGEYLDNYSWTYKLELADLWHSILGVPPRDEAAYLAWLEPIAKAPDRAEDLPPGAQRLVQWLDEVGAPADRQTIRRFTIPTRIVEIPPPDNAPPEVRARGPQSQIVPELGWPEWAGDGDVEQVLAYLRRKVITGDELNMDPAYMLELAQRFGPIDWRQPAAHTLYWSYLGLQRSAADDRESESVIATHRNVLNALQTLAQSGQVVYEPKTRYISYLPSWGFWIPYDDYFHEAVLTAMAPEKIEELFGPGYRNQMDLAIAYAATFGDAATANALYTRMQDRYRGTDKAPRYTVPIDDFVFQKLAENIDEPKIARGTMVALLTQSVTNTVVYNRPRDAEAQLQKARQLYGEYRRLNPVEKDPLHGEFPPFESLQRDAVVNFVLGIAGPQGVGVQRIPMEYRSGVYRGMTPEVQAAVYLQHGESLVTQARQEGIDPDLAFPRPPAELLQRVQQQLTAEAARQQQAQPGQGTRMEGR